MKVQITKCSDSTFWYHDRIGEVFKVVDYDNTDYEVYEDGPNGDLIARVDCWPILDSNYPYDESPVKRPIDEIPKHLLEEVPGGSTPSQYGLPDNATDLQDLIEHREMNFSIGNIFKACYRMGACNHSDKLRDLHKIVWFANREIKRLNHE